MARADSSRISTEVRFDWSIACEHTVLAAFDMARTLCRRAERHLLQLIL